MLPMRLFTRRHNRACIFGTVRYCLALIRSGEAIAGDLMAFRAAGYSKWCPVASVLGLVFRIKASYSLSFSVILGNGISIETTSRDIAKMLLRLFRRGMSQDCH